MRCCDRRSVGRRFLFLALLLAPSSTFANLDVTDNLEFALSAVRAPHAMDVESLGPAPAADSSQGSPSNASECQVTATSAMPDAEDFTWIHKLLSATIGLISLGVVGNGAYTKFFEDVDLSWLDVLWPVLVTSALSALNVFLWLVVLVRGVGDSQDNVVTWLMQGCVAWWLLTFFWQWSKGSANLKDTEVFIAEDLYNDLSKPMFVVFVHFLLQALLMLILVFVAESRVKEGIPDDLSPTQTGINLVLALILQLYLFHAMKVGGTWEELLKLKDAKVIELTEVDGVPEEERMSKVTKGEWFLRMAMSILNQGIFAKFLIVSYPLFIFPTSSLIDLVKDAFAITFVNELGDMSSSTTFMVRIESAAEAWARARAAGVAADEKLATEMQAFAES